MGCSPDAFNALGNLVGSPPLMINETILTLEHVMERLDVIEKKMLMLIPLTSTSTYVINLWS